MTETTITFKLYRNATKIFKKDFPKFCEKHDVVCIITSKSRLFCKDEITLVLKGYDGSINYIENELKTLLKWVI